MGLGGILKSIGRFGAGLIPGGGTAMNILDTIGNVSGVVSPILGGAAKGRAEGRNAEFDNKLALGHLNLDNAKFNLTAPRTRLGTGARAATVGARPMKLNWDGPGSGLRGQTLRGSGGSYDAMADPRLKQLADSVMEGEIKAQLGGPRPEMAMPQSSGLDKTLGAATFATSLLGGLKKAGIFNRKSPVQAAADEVGL